MPVTFIDGGLEIPDELLRAHDDGQVVFFCGAGISALSKLPSFSTLVDELYDKFYVPLQEDEKHNLEVAIQSLERQLPNGRHQVRRKVREILTPSKKVTDTHSAILTLARNYKNKKTRLITTNFDLLFEEAIEETKIKTKTFCAPLLPMVREPWEGLIYLHGRLPSNEDDEEDINLSLDGLILTTADFGHAYLFDAWATTFMIELFKKYNVCFIGYSISDPVMRYMIDALAADSAIGGKIPKHFIFVPYKSDAEKDNIRRRWQDRNMVPILYKVQGEEDHILLHKTLQKWAADYRDGVDGKCAIVHELSSQKLLFNSSRMIWALESYSRSPTGEPAKHFADIDPVPSLDWLEEPKFEDLILREKPAEILEKLISKEEQKSVLENLSLPENSRVRKNLEGWLLKHLDTPRLAFWATRNQAKLSRSFIGQIKEKLKEVQLNSKMSTFWSLFIHDRIRNRFLERDPKIYEWVEDFKPFGLSTSLREKLRRILEGYVTISKGYGEKSDEIKELLFEIEFDPYHEAAFDELNKDPKWQEILPELLSDFTIILQNNLRLMKEIGNSIPEKECFSHWYGTPSISEHEQNKNRASWVKIIDLNRDAWLKTAYINPTQAQRIMEEWWSSPYLLFKRLALFAAAQNIAKIHASWVEWLLEETTLGRVLWLQGMHREVMRILYSCSANLSSDQLNKLESYILAGPPDNMIYEGRGKTYMMWLRLTKIEHSGANLSIDAKNKFQEFSSKNPSWKLHENQEEEFIYWTSSNMPYILPIKTPRGRQDLCNYLKKSLNDDPFKRDDWFERCKNEFPRAICALYSLDKENIFLKDRWSIAFGIWSGQDSKRTKRINQSWRLLAKVINKWTDDQLYEISGEISFWLKEVSKNVSEYEDIFINICHRMLKLHQFISLKLEDAVLDLTGHAITWCTWALLNHWHINNSKPGQNLPPALKFIFSEICTNSITIYKHGRFVLGIYLKVLFPVDQAWTKKYLTPLLNWDNPIEAATIWSGFLYSPSALPDILYRHIKNDFINLINNIEKVGEYGKNYPNLLTYFTLHKSEIFTKNELREAIGKLPSEGLLTCLQELIAYQNAATIENRPKEYWENRIVYYLDNVYPQTRLKKEDREKFAESFAKLAIVSDEAFPDALIKVKKWLVKISYPNQILFDLHNSELCSTFPKETLELFSEIIEASGFPPIYLRECLNKIAQSSPELKNSESYKQLNGLVEKEIA